MSTTNNILISIIIKYNNLECLSFLILILGHLSNSKEDIRRSTGPPSDWLLGVEKELWTQESDTQERQRFDQVLETVLSELEPICLSEQNFCVSFFQLDVLSPTTKVCTNFILFSLKIEFERLI